MNFSNLTKVSVFEFRNEIIKEIPNVSKDQLRIIYNEDRFIKKGYYVYKTKDKKEANIWIRLSIILVPIVFILMLIGYPFTFIIMGRFGYGRKFDWVLNWLDRFSK